MVGLKTPHNIAYYQQLTEVAGSANHSKQFAAMVKAEQPQFLIVQNAWDVNLHMAAGLNQAGVHLTLRRFSEDGYKVYQFSY